MSNYPTELEGSITAASGELVAVRPLRREDAPLLRRELDAADDETLYYRFFRPRPDFDDDTIAYLTDLDYDRRFALVAEIDGEPVAIARYEALPESGRAEVAVTVKPEWRRRRLGAELLDRVMARAATQGFATLEAVCLAENGGAIQLLETAGFRFGPVDRGVRVGEADLRCRSVADEVSSSPR